MPSPGTIEVHQSHREFKDGNGTADQHPFQDGHRGTTAEPARTFNVEAKAGQTYDVRVYLDRVAATGTAYDQLQVAVEGGGGWHTDKSAVPSDRYDLLTVLAHKLGHALGREHTDEGVMAPVLNPGERASEIDAFFASDIGSLLG